MVTILAIETSAELASVALLRNGQVLCKQSETRQTHSETILPMVRQLLAEAGIGLGQCDALAFGSGPGSFTGVRTACGVVQGLAFGSGLPVVPVVTLLAMARACRVESGADDVMAILDARMGEVYWAQYRFDGQWQTVVVPTLARPEEVSPTGSVKACGNGLQAYAEAFHQKAFAVDAMPQVMPHAADIAQLAAIAFAHGDALPAHEAQPLYLRNKVALTTSERMAQATGVSA